jgi:NAD(P)-dependent dehydrogenase (short-subunit alcohol dehydrogenase family)/pimeloyl-ACP methyl ester carboxylesterase
VDDDPRGRLEDHWTDVHGLRMFARVSVDPPAASAAPVVLVPGLNVSSRHMVQLGELLAPHVRVYSPDLPGYGRSEKPRHFLTLPELSDALAEWMTAVGLDRAALLGSSYSAQIVADFAVRYPERITRAVLASPTVDPRSRPLPKLFWLWRVNEGREPKHVGQTTMRDYQDVGPLRALFTMWQMVRDHVEERLPRIRVPTLVVRGGRDPLVPQQWGAEITRLVPNARLAVIPHGAHALNLDAPLELARVVRPFLTDASPTARPTEWPHRELEWRRITVPGKLRSAVVVITGASSGIGRATALAFARRGATVVLAARREQALRELAADCERLGARAVATPTDVTDEGAVQELARRAVEQFGRLDVWVNNAAVALFARFEEMPPEACRRVIETNLFGYIYGARAALPYFREQGSGVLINVASIAGRVGQPYTSAYVTTKWGIRGLSECLRQELALDCPHAIHVCTVFPASIDTPLFQQGANYTGRAVKPMSPVYDAEQVAQTIVRLAEHPRREALVGRAGRMLSLLHTVAPGFAERLLARQVETDHFQDAPAPASAGNLFEPLPQWASVSGGWKVGGGAPRRYVAAAGLATLAPALLAWLWLRPRWARR